MGIDGRVVWNKPSTTITFPDVPPVELCRRYSCLDNFNLCGCVAKATDNLVRLDAILQQPRQTVCVMRSYRAAAAAATTAAAAAPANEREVRTASLLADRWPPTGRMGEDVYGLLENLGALVTRLERDIHTSWTRIQQLEACSALVRCDMHRTSSGSLGRMHAAVQKVWNQWWRESEALRNDVRQTRQQNNYTAYTLAMLHHKVSDMDEHLLHVCHEELAVDHNALLDEQRRLKRQLRVLETERQLQQQHASRAQAVLDDHQSAAAASALQQTAVRRRHVDQLRAGQHDKGVATDQLEWIEACLETAAAEARDAEAQVSESFTRIAETLAETGHLLRPELATTREPVDALYVLMSDAMTQLSQRLASTRSRQLQTEWECRDVAVQICEMYRLGQALKREKKEVNAQSMKAKHVADGDQKRLRQSVGIFSKRIAEAQKKILASSNREREMRILAEVMQPAFRELETNIKELKEKLRCAKQEELPLVTRLKFLEAQYEEQQNAAKERFNKTHAELENQKNKCKKLEKRLADAQRWLQRAMETLERTLLQQDLMETAFQHAFRPACSALDQLNVENARILSQLTQVSRSRSAADVFMNTHGAALRTQQATTTFALHQWEADVFDLSRQLQWLAASLQEARASKQQHSDLLRMLLPTAARMDERGWRLDSELSCLRDVTTMQAARLLAAATALEKWQRMHREQQSRHEEYLRQARLKTDELCTEYQRGVELNASLREEYEKRGNKWLSARIRAAKQIQPQLVCQTELANVMQVVQVVRLCLESTRHFLALRHLYFSGERQRGQVRLAELAYTLRQIKNDTMLASDHVVRTYIHLIKGEMPFVMRAEPETIHVRKTAVQTETPPPAPRALAVKTTAYNGGWRDRLVRQVAELGRPGAAGCRLPSVGRNNEKPVRGLGKLHTKVHLPKLK